MPAMPSIGEVIRVNPRSSSALATTALAASTPAWAATIAALRRFNSGSGSLDLSLAGEIALDGVIEILIGNGLLLCERRIAIDVELSLALICLGSHKLSLEL